MDVLDTQVDDQALIDDLLEKTNRQNKTSFVQRLNIPLSKHKKTTHRNRWVVWLWLFFLIFAGLFIFNLARIWFTRVTVFDAAPSNTILAIQLVINDDTEETLERVLENVPLISNRSIGFADLLPFVHGQIGWFFSENGSRAVAFKGSSEKVNEELQGSGIQITRTKSGTLLLSENLPAITGVIETQTPSFFPNLFTHYLGQVVLPNDDILAKIIGNKSGISIISKTQTDKGNIMQLPKNTILALSTQAWTNDELETFIENFLNRSMLKNLGDFDYLSVNSDIVLQKNDLTTDFVISTEMKEGVDVPELLQTIAATQNPKIIERILSDNTVSGELRFEPDFITIEEISNGGSTYFRTKINSGYLLAAESHNQLFLSNNEGLLSFTLHPESQPEENLMDVQDLCGATLLYMNPKMVLDGIHTGNYNASYSFIDSVIKQFSAISLETLNGSTRLNLCMF